jgi:hypothetical protein
MMLTIDKNGNIVTYQKYTTMEYIFDRLDDLMEYCTYIKRRLLDY